jgi:hypothetical protein
MAGSFGFKPNQKSKTLIKKNNSEVLKEFSESSSSKSEKKTSGKLFPGQSFHPNQESSPNNINWNREFLFKTSSEEHPVFVNQHQQEIQQAINEILEEIKKLKLTTDNLDHEIVQATEQNVSEINEYQLRFLQRIKNLIVQFRQNIDQSCVWMDHFNHKKSRKNAFWNKAKSKNGGEQYLMSGEHSASRSAN